MCILYFVLYLNQTWTWVGFTHGLVGLGLGRIFEISVGWVGSGENNFI